MIVKVFVLLLVFPKPKIQETNCRLIRVYLLYHELEILVMSYLNCTDHKATCSKCSINHYVTHREGVPQGTILATVMLM